MRIKLFVVSHLLLFYEADILPSAPDTSVYPSGIQRSGPLLVCDLPIVQGLPKYCTRGKISSSDDVLSEETPAAV